MRIWAALFSIAAALISLPVAACPPDFQPFGLTGRSTSEPFSNTNGLLGRHESWADRGADLEIHAGYSTLTDEYGHGVLGSLRDAKMLSITITKPGTRARFTCPNGIHLTKGQVFEDIAPRLVDLTGDGLPEIITVQSSASQGARIAVYDRAGMLVATTPYIGRPYRWLAPIGAADLDGDGNVEIAYIDRPHLAKRLRIWRFAKGQLTHVVDHEGLTNHQIGWDHIPGGIRDCGGGPRLITANADFSQIIETRLANGHLTTRPIARYTGPNSLNAALTCD